jgi:hypothetical protein
MIEIILVLVAVSLLIGLIYYNKRDKENIISEVSDSSLRYATIISPEFEKFLNKWKKEVDSLSKKRRNNVSKKRKIRTNKTKKTGNRKG